MSLLKLNGGASGGGWSTCHQCCWFVYRVSCIRTIGDFERDFTVSFFLLLILLLGFFFNFFLNWVGFHHGHIQRG
ncbi:hypothetical protein ES332_A03G020000v1 [Gossypium tomentosum]|uniref:Uncharacterized protein n=1 Tax=Gossypium tomentosum TaxID=34277 RepID=A0A5D2R141_GOSTO|nr:hypothetical protein ES332_A03G020000v1 [Gossypium tomentosum]